MTLDRSRLALAALIAAAAAIAAGMLYLLLGARLAGEPAPAAADARHLAPENIEAMVERLARRLESQPDDGAGWLMLARSYAALGRFADSARAYGKAAVLLPPQADLLADYADVQAMANGRDLTGEPEKLATQALALDPGHAKALALLGAAAFRRADYRQALAHWQKAVAAAPADAELAASLQRSIADARAHLDGAGAQARDGKAIRLNQ